MEKASAYQLMMFQSIYNLLQLLYFLYILALLPNRTERFFESTMNIIYKGSFTTSAIFLEQSWHVDGRSISSENELHSVPHRLPVFSAVISDIPIVSIFAKSIDR